MKAYLIDPAARTVSEVEYSGDYHQITTYIAGGFDDCRLFTAVYSAILKEDGSFDPAKAYDVFVDDEGLINGNPHGWFMLAGYEGLLRGRGLVLGHDGMGESIEPPVTLAELTKAVSFPTEAQVWRMIEALS